MMRMENAEVLEDSDDSRIAKDFAINKKEAVQIMRRTTTPFTLGKVRVYLGKEGLPSEKYNGKQTH
jgi:hypothetical protein